MDPDKEADQIKEIVDRVSDHYKSHLYQIDRREAKEIGLKVRDATDQEAEAMWSLLSAFMSIQLEGEGTVNGEPAVPTPTRTHHVGRGVFSRARTRQEERAGERRRESVGIEVVG